MLFDDWYGLLRVLIVGTSAYAGLVSLLRLTGKRTLSKMNAFDLIVTVALGSTLATVLLSRHVALAEGMLLAAIRARGIADPASVGAVVLETDGSFSVVSSGEGPVIGSLRYVRRRPSDGGAIG